ncbi:MAG TPA: prephenate dehydrogenase/arogenate dehydrogenase family protein [Vicinamibacterales bacterium]|nr:prephenate dehydrogenase/arogenate dehydrogenase family protein [Vicinamibacterales bacterium]
MNEAHSSLAIVGPGLIGTSVGLAARRRWPELEVRTVDKGEPLDKIDNALVVVLAAPVDAILAMLPSLARVVPKQALVIDTGSTKRAIMVAAAQAGLRQFVGGHPMAGGTVSGPAGARADLFDGRTWFLTNPDVPDAVRRAVKFVEALGARPVILADHGEEHDRLMAALSHLPQITASMLMAVVARVAGESNLQWAGHGLRDTTRLAASRPEMWQGVLATNREELKPLIKYLASELSSFADRLDDPDSVRALFEEAARAKSSCL